MATVAVEFTIDSPSKLEESVVSKTEESDASVCSNSTDTDSEYSASDSDYSSDYDSEEEEANAALEQELRMNMAHQAQQRSGGVFVSRAVGNLLKKNASDPNLRVMPELGLPVLSPPFMRRGSANDAIGSSNHSANGESRLAMCIQTILPTQTFHDKSKGEHPMANTNPSETLKSIRQSMGRSSDPIRSDSIKDFFQHSEKHIAAYDLKVMTAVRSNDMEAMKVMLASGKELQCCNRFYESILHTVARRGLPEMLDFLLVKAKLNLRVCCASGRTPLHDACWTTTPDFGCIKRILLECPDFLLIADNRNYTPLNYVPRDCWGEWNDFLVANPDLVAGSWFM